MKTTFADRRVTIIGMAREGTALARYLSHEGARVTVSDRRGIADLAEEIGQLAGLPIQCVLRDHPDDLLDADTVFVSPGVPREIPFLATARARGIPLSSETELLFERCPAPIIGVTGSSGKTTTATLIGEMMRVEHRRRLWVGGNMGRPLIEHVNEMRPTDWVVLELSSFQLDALRRSPHIAVFTNLRPNHLDRHGTFEAYRAAKANILRHQGTGDIAVLNHDDPEVCALAEQTRAQVRWFSRRTSVEEGTCVEKGWIVSRSRGQVERLMPVEALALRGAHNLENALAAFCAVTAAGLRGASAARAASTFAGVPHRLELVREREGVRWVNDSIATSPDRTMAALAALESEAIILLAGGRDKHLPMEALGKAIVRGVKRLITFGEMGPLVQQAVQEARAQLNGSGREIPVTACATLGEAIAVAAAAAEPGDTVLLSPSGTSFDAYRDFEARGDHFRALVHAL